MKRLSIVAGLLALLLSACGGGYSINEFPRIEIEIDNKTPVVCDDGTLCNGQCSPGAGCSDEPFKVSFSQALQLATDVKVQLVNPGNEPLIITDIGWQESPSGDGSVLKNPHVELQLTSSSGFPITVDTEGMDKLTFTVVYSPPLGTPLTDFSESVLVIKSNARDNTNKKDVKEVVIRFTMQEKEAYPLVNPSSYTFNNATLAKPETQVFRIENDPDLGQAAFSVLSVSLAKVSSEFILSDLPNAGEMVLGITDPMYEPVTFKVTYQPVDEGQDENLIQIETDAGLFTVPLKSDLIRGNYSLSFSHVDNFDFTNIFETESRRVIVYSEGPGPLTVKEPKISGEGANNVFSWKAYKPKTTPDGPQEEITSFPRGLKKDQSIEFEVTYAPGPDAGVSPNANFDIPIGTPDPGEINIPIFAGTPKPLLDIAPAGQSVIVTAPFDTATTGSRNVIVYNNGNGGLTLKGVNITDEFNQPSEVFTLANPPAPDTLIQPGGMLILEVQWDRSGVPDGKSEKSGSLHIDYIHFSDGQVTENVYLKLQDSGATEAPTASLGDAASYADAVAGENVVLSSAGSSAGAFNFTGSNWALYYLTEKPAGSWAQLNAETGPTVEFVPDVPGTYSFELVVYATSDSSFLFSDPATLTFNVGASTP